MGAMLWCARLGTTDGRALGAGMLLAGNRVLTCAHVVNGYTDVQVSFPGVAENLPGIVEWRGPWTPMDERGDVALVALAGEVPVDGCVLAGLDALRPQAGCTSHELRAMGFPRGHDRDGIHVTLRTSDDRGLRREWLTLDVVDAHLQSLAEGFSGAAVWTASSGEVVGMITDAAFDDEGGSFTGRMLPLDTIRRYWEDLDDFLPLTWMPPQQRQELRTALHGITTARSLQDIFREAFPTFLRVPDFESPWAAIRYLGESMPGDDRLYRFLSTLKAYLSLGTQAGLVGWLGRWFPGLADTESRPPKVPEASVVVILRTPTRGGRTHGLLTVRTLIDGSWSSHAQPMRIRTDQIQAEVERAVTSQLDQVHRMHWMIEFAVPPRELGLPFDEWKFQAPGAARPRAMRSVPLIVWHVNRLEPSGLAARLALKRWETLRDRGKTMFVPVGCQSKYDFEQFSDWLDADDELCALAYASNPKEEWLEAAWDNGVPIMIWCRRGCTGCSDAHEVFLRQITEMLSATDPDRLPAEVMRLRKVARSPMGGGVDHCGRSLTLFWDDPARIPDPPLGYRGD